MPKVTQTHRPFSMGWNSTVSGVEGEIRDGERLRLRAHPSGP
jgi:hypothetical protein